MIPDYPAPEAPSKHHSVASREVVRPKQPNSSDESSPLRGHIPSLDGWRAISIILVIFAHSLKSEGFPDLLKPVFNYLTGELGVQVFFVISGFLITWLLIRERDKNGSVNLKSFYERRAIRILPVYIAFVIAMAVVQLFTTYHGSAAQWIRVITFTANYAPAPPAMTHLWSLSVEEQFYLIWPACFLAAVKKGLDTYKLQRILVAVVIVSPVFRIMGKYTETPLLGYMSFLTNCDLLAWGCLTAVVLWRNMNWFQSKLIRHQFLLTLMGLLCVFLPIVLVRHQLLGIITLPFRFTSAGIGVSILLLVSIFNFNKGFWRLLNLPMVRWLGILSYSLYLWHRPFSVQPELFGLTNIWWMEFPALLLVSISVASFSYYFLERPLLSFRKSLRRTPATQSSIGPTP